MKTIDALRFDNSYARLPEAFRARLQPTPLEGARLACFNPAAAGLIDLHPDEAGRGEFVDYLNGNRPLPGAEPTAAIYAGHQFGHFVPQLGDGRAILLGEVINGRGERWDLQLKGAGLTPFSRRGDGRAVLRSTIREYLCSEAMHGLGIPTTRALCLIDSDEEVYREQIERGALLLRMAPSHLRFGSFEVFYYRRQFAELKQLADYAIDLHFPELSAQADPYLALFREVIAHTAKLIAQWQLVGFAHGVMNTDNMSLLGLTIDYGPFGFLDAFDPGHICNHSDHYGRYAFDQQPEIAGWNLSRLGQALLPLFAGEDRVSVKLANEALAEFGPQFHQHYAAGMHRKLGLREAHSGDGGLIDTLLTALKENRVDYSNFFRALGNLQLDNPAADAPIRDLFLDRSAFDRWAESYRARLRAEGSRDEERSKAMHAVNPKYVLRNYLAQQAIERAEQERDFSEVDALLRLLQDPFDEHPEHTHYAALPPDWASAIEVSCSS